MKEKKSTKKYAIDGPFNDSITNQNHLSDIREQLRYTLEQLEQHKLSSQLQAQKRMISQQQCQNLREQNEQLRQQLQQIKRQLGKFAKKLSKLKEQKGCERCKNEEQLKEKAERERQIFFKQRNILKNEIAELKKALEIVPKQQQSYLNSSIQTLRRQLDYKTKAIEDQRKVIKYLDDRLSNFQLEKMQTLNYVQQVDQRFQQLQMENLILKGTSLGNHGHGGHKQNLSPSRKNGSIKNLQRSRSRVSKHSPTRY